MGFQQEFIWPGLDDMTGWMATPAALSVINSLGFDRIQERNKKYSLAAIKL